MNKKLFIFSLLASILGIINTFLFCMVNFFTTPENHDYDFIYYILNSLKLYTFYSPFYEISIKTGVDSSIGYSLNLVGLFFCITFLVGAIVFSISKGKEMRLLRFNFGLIILSKVFDLPFLFIGIIQLKLTFYSIFYWLFWALYIYFAYKALQYLNKQKEVIIIENTVSVASKTKRFLHLLLDNTLTFIIVYGLIADSLYNETLKSFFRMVDDLFGDEFGFWVLFAVFRLTYYFVFEYFFQATPAKFLTETRVYDETDEIPSFKSILRRSFSRLIPFDSLTFLFGNNWHDNLSETYVVNEKENESNGTSYSLFLIILLIIFVVIYFLR